MSAPPNIVFLMPDQLRPDFLGCYGARFLRTPRIDALAAQGTRHTTCISPSPICVPARASMLTGQSAVAHGVLDNLHWPRPDRADMGVQSWPELLSVAGYLTSAIGKMHFYPWDISEGFAQRVIAEDKRHIHIADDYADALRSAGHARLHGRDQRRYADWMGASFNDLPDALQPDRWVAGQTVDAIRAFPTDRPLAMMVGFPGPHCPYDPPEEALTGIDPATLPSPLPATVESDTHRAAFVASYKRSWADLDYEHLNTDQIRRIRHHYAASVERLDADVGAILDALSDCGRLDNTIVVFASDHGDYLGDFGLVGKTYFHEPSVRVPLIVAEFRNGKAGVSETPVSLLDLYPSFLNWAGLRAPPHAEGTPLGTARDDRVIVGATIHGTMARARGWKLVRYQNGAEALYDLERDPGEQADCIAKRPDIRARLDAAMTRALLHGLGGAHADKRVAEAQAAPDHAFYQRGWARPYPARQI